MHTLQMPTAPYSFCCRGLGFGDSPPWPWPRTRHSTSHWVPFYASVRTGRLCASPTCDTTRKPRCRRGMAARSSTGEVAEGQGMEVGSSKRVIPKYLLGKSYSGMVKIVDSFGEQKYRAKQLHQLIYTSRMRTLQECAQSSIVEINKPGDDDCNSVWACDAELIQALFVLEIFTCSVPKQLRDAMELAGWSIGRSPTHGIVTSIDGVVKIMLRLEDNRLVEAVGIPVKGRGRELRLTACLSSQVGCALKCTFCATGKGGFGRNLKLHEIVDQVFAIEDVFRQPVTHVEFMGMGEPLMNIGAVLDAHRTISKEFKIAQPMMKISTVGVRNTIRRLAAQKLGSPLVVSLHAANQELRSEIVPSANQYPLDALMEDCRYYYERTEGCLSFEYTLLAGVNDQREHADELATLLHHWNFGHINLTPYNPIDDPAFERPSKAKVLAFVETLAERGVSARVRLARGLDATAACGQLRNEFQKFPLQSPTDTQREALQKFRRNV